MSGWLGRLAGMTLGVAIGLGAWAGAAAPAAADTTIEVTIKDHRFNPAEIRVKAGERSILKIKNEDATPEEFESNVLKIEKVIAGGSVGTLRLRALEPGRYPFEGEHHPETAKGLIIAE